MNYRIPLAAAATVATAIGLTAYEAAASGYTNHEKAPGITTAVFQTMETRIRSLEARVSRLEATIGLRSNPIWRLNPVWPPRGQQPAQQAPW